MSSEQRKHYTDMEERLKVEINDVRIAVPIRLTQMMKLRQITGGFIIDHQEASHAMTDNPKLEALDSLLNEEIAREHKVIIWAEYRWEIETIKNRYKDHGVVTIYGGNTTQVNLANQVAFKTDPSIRIIVAHPKSMAHGVTLTMANYMIFYSISHSAEDNYQCVRRIERAGQRNAMFVYYLLCKKSVDPMIYKAIAIKNKNQSELLDQRAVDQMLLNLWMEVA